MNAFEQKLGLDRTPERVIHRFTVPESIPGEATVASVYSDSVDESATVGKVGPSCNWSSTCQLETNTASGASCKKAIYP